MEKAPGSAKNNDSLEMRGIPEMMRRLIPWINAGTSKQARVAILHGGQEIGSFTVRTHGRNSEIAEAPTYSLFGRGRASIGALIQARYGIDARNCSFVAYDIEAQGVTSAEEVQSPVPVASEEAAPAPVPEPPAQEEDATQSEAADEGAPAAEGARNGSIKSSKVGRKPLRRKPIKAERNARLAERIEEEYSARIQELRADVLEVKLNREFQQGKPINPFNAVQAIAQFFSRNPQYRRKFIESVTHDPAYQDIYLTLALMRIEEEDQAKELKKFPRLTAEQRSFTAPGGINIYNEIRGIKLMFELFNDLFPPIEHKDALRSRQGMFHFMTTARTFPEYQRLLFPEMDNPLELAAYIITRGSERWIDIGSGNTYRLTAENEDVEIDIGRTSLMNAIKFLNPNIQMVGIDMLYTQSAATLDKAEGSHVIDAEAAAGNQLVGAPAQRLPFQDESFDEVLSSWVFDKFNEETGAAEQGLRETARVLKPGGLARIFAIDRKYIESPLLHTYFNVLHQMEFVSIKNRALARLILERKQLNKPETEKLLADIKSWQEAHMAEGPEKK